MIVTTFAYLRASDRKQDKSVEDQRAAIEQRAGEDGLRIAPDGWFVDDALSGQYVASRPAILAMRAMVQERVDNPVRGETLVCYAWAQSRLGRNAPDTVATLALFDLADVHTRFLTDPEPEDVEMRETIRFNRALQDAGHSRRLKKDVPRGMKREARKGNWTCGRPPFGFRVEHHTLGKSGKLVVHMDEATVIVLVFDLYEAGYGDKAIAALLTGRGVPPPAHPTKLRRRVPGTWRAKHVQHILTSVVNAGMVQYRVHTPKAKRALLGTFTGDAVTTPGAHEAIIDPERFERVQALRRSKFRAKNRENPMSASDHGLFKQWLVCGVCGGTIMVQPGRGELRYYCCRVRTENKRACTGTNARIDLLDAVLLGAVEELLIDDALAAAVARWSASLDGAGRQELERRRATIQARIAKADAGVRSIVAMVGRQEVEEGDIADERRRLMAERQAARDDLALLPAPTSIPTITAGDLDAFRGRVRTAFADKPMIERRKALSLLISSITLNPNEALIRYRPRVGGGGDPHHDPYGPPYAPRSFRVPSTSL